MLNMPFSRNNTIIFTDSKKKQTTLESDGDVIEFLKTDSNLWCVPQAQLTRVIARICAIKVDRVHIILREHVHKATRADLVPEMVLKELLIVQRKLEERMAGDAVIKIAGSHHRCDFRRWLKTLAFRYFRKTSTHHGLKKVLGSQKRLWAMEARNHALGPAPATPVSSDAETEILCMEETPSRPRRSYIHRNEPAENQASPRPTDFQSQPPAVPQHMILGSSNLPQLYDPGNSPHHFTAPGDGPVGMRDAGMRSEVIGHQPSLGNGGNTALNTLQIPGGMNNGFTGMLSGPPDFSSLRTNPPYPGPPNNNLLGPDLSNTSNRFQNGISLAGAHLMPLLNPLQAQRGLDLDRVQADFQNYSSYLQPRGHLPTSAYSGLPAYQNAANYPAYSPALNPAGNSLSAPGMPSRQGYCSSVSQQPMSMAAHLQQGGVPHNPILQQNLAPQNYMTTNHHQGGHSRNLSPEQLQRLRRSISDRVRARQQASGAPQQTYALMPSPLSRGHHAHAHPSFQPQAYSMESSNGPGIGPTMYNDMSSNFRVGESSHSSNNDLSIHSNVNQFNHSINIDMSINSNIGQSSHSNNIDLSSNSHNNELSHSSNVGQSNHSSNNVTSNLYMGYQPGGDLDEHGDNLYDY